MNILQYIKMFLNRNSQFINILYLFSLLTYEISFRFPFYDIKYKNNN